MLGPRALESHLCCHPPANLQKKVVSQGKRVLISRLVIMSHLRPTFLRAACSVRDIAVRFRIGKLHLKTPFVSTGNEERGDLVALRDVCVVAPTCGY